MKMLIKIIVGSVVMLLAAMGGLAVFLSSDSGQRWLREFCVGKLADTLHTRIDVKHIGIGLLTGDVTLYGAEIYDRSEVKMLSVDTLEADIDLTGIFHREIGIEGVRLAGATAVLYKERPDTAANYQFVFDELKRKKKEEAKGEKKEPAMRLVMDLVEVEVSRTNLKWDVKSEPHKEAGTFDVNHLDVTGFAVKLQGSMLRNKNLDFRLADLRVGECQSGMKLSLGSASYKAVKGDTLRLSLENLNFRYQDKQVGLGLLQMKQKADSISIDKEMKVTIDALTYKNNNGKPRKNTGRPNRGWFDKGHLDAVINAKATIHSLRKDSVNVTIHGMSAKDKGSGLDIRNIVAQLRMTANRFVLQNMRIDLARTRIYINNVSAAYRVVKGDKAKGKKGTVAMRFDTFPLKASVGLQDIARPFAPPLSNFTTPLRLSVNVGGDLSRIAFSNIRISTPDGRLALTASGDLCNVLEKKRLCLHFNNIHLSARNGVKDQIVNHFAKKVRLKMMRQLAAMGDITYNGSLGIYYKREDVRGRMSCRYGNVDFAFTLNGITKYMTGTLGIDSMNLGDIMNVKGLWIDKTRAAYSFSIASMRKTPGHGRLPQGWLKATINDARYKKVGFRNIYAEIRSDGVEAKGSVKAFQKLIDIMADFTYRQTDTEQSFRVHPHLKLHEKSAAEISEKERKKAEKEAAKAEKRAAKAARKAEKAARRAERKAAKEALKKEKEKGE